MKIHPKETEAPHFLLFASVYHKQKKMSKEKSDILRFFGAFQDPLRMIRSFKNIGGDHIHAHGDELFRLYGIVHRPTVYRKSVFVEKRYGFPRESGVIGVKTQPVEEQRVQRFFCNFADEPLRLRRRRSRLSVRRFSRRKEM